MRLCALRLLLCLRRRLWWPRLCMSLNRTLIHAAPHSRVFFRAVFVPASVLAEGANEVIVFESDPPAPGSVAGGAAVAGDGARQLSSTDQQLWMDYATGLCTVGLSPTLA